MKYLTITLFAVLSLCCTTSCDYIKNYDKPHLELLNQTPYTLNITKFDWTYGIVAINQFSGDFDRLDEKVYNLLKDKTGACQVYIELKNIDKYGSTNSTLKHIGVINIDELNRFQDWQYWQKDGGIRKLIYTHMILNQAHLLDSTVTTTVDTTIHPNPPINHPPYKPTRINKHIYSFSEAMLNPTEEDRKDLDSARFVVNGIIEDANFLNGVIQIQTKDELLNVQFNPFGLSSDVNYKLRLALAAGNHIKSICARAGANTLDLVSAEITSMADADVMHGDTTKK